MEHRKAQRYYSSSRPISRVCPMISLKNRRSKIDQKTTINQKEESHLIGIHPIIEIHPKTIPKREMQIGIEAF